MNHPPSVHFLAAALGVSLAVAQENSPPKPESAVKQTAPGEYVFGEITIDAKKRQVSFPAHVNMLDGNLEYAIVHETGKVHESLFVTPITSRELQIALLLCHFKADAKAIDPETNEVTHLAIWIDWQDLEGKAKTAPLHAWIYNGIREKALEKHAWVFNGSPVAKPGEPPIEDASLVAIYLDPYAPINYIDPNNNNDELWYPTPGVMPPIGTPVKIRIAPMPGENKSTPEK